MYLFVTFLALPAVLVVGVYQASKSAALRSRIASALLLGCAAVTVCSRSSELNAQQVQLRQQTGLYLPTRFSIRNGVLDVQQKIGVRVGARLTLTFNERFDVTTGVSYIPGYATLHAAGKRIDLGTSSHLLTAAIGARYWLLPPPRMLSWEVHTGLGMVAGGQPAYADLLEGSTLSGVLGTTVRYQFRRIVSLWLRVQDRLYRVRLGGGDPGRSRRPLQLSFGLSFPFLDLSQNREPQSAAAGEPPAIDQALSKPSPHHR